MTAADQINLILVGVLTLAGFEALAAMDDGELGNFLGRLVASAIVAVGWLAVIFVLIGRFPPGALLAVLIMSSLVTLTALPLLVYGLALWTEILAVSWFFATPMLDWTIRLATVGKLR